MAAVMLTTSVSICLGIDEFEAWSYRLSLSNSLVQGHESLKDMTDKTVYKKLANIFNDESHPLRQEFDSLIIARSGRLRLPKVNTERYLKSFVTNAVKMFNSNYSR